MAFDGLLQRKIMGQFATGVTVVTTRFGDGEVTGMTANAVMSLSLVPPLVVVSVNKESGMHAALEAGRCYAINILKRDQEDLSNRFATPGPKDFSDLNLEEGETGVPILADALAWIECRLTEVVPAGDHNMFLGEPVAGHAGEGEPLLFFGGQYRGLTV